MIIDFHTHTFPEKIAGRAIAGLEKSSGGKAFLNGTLKDLKKSMVKANIQTSVLLPIAVKTGQSKTINSVAVQNNKEDGFISFGSVHPFDEDFKDELKKIKDAGLKGIKLHPDFQGVFLNDEKMVEVMKYATHLGLLITIHAGEDVSYPNLHRSTPKMLKEILPELKGAKIICAHSGGYNYLQDFLNLLLYDEEIYIDTSFSIGKMDEKLLKEIYTNINPNHILFGTDSPWDSQENAVRELKTFGFSKELEDRIFYKNALELLKD